jgi:hypothetical protein
MKYEIRRKRNRCGTYFWCVFGPHHGAKWFLLSHHYTWQKAVDWLEAWLRKREAA